MPDLIRDLRYGLRLVRRSPGFAAAAASCLALGIGANTAIFSVVDAVLWKPLPYQDPERLVLVWEKPPQFERNTVSAPNFVDWREQNQVFEGMAAASAGSAVLSGVDPPEELAGARVTHNYFQLLGAAPFAGRLFLPEEERAVLLSHRFWRRRFGADRGLLGRTLALNGESYTVVGVLKPNSKFDRGRTEVWMPLVFDRRVWRRDYHYLTVLARLPRGVTLQQARAGMDTIARRLEQEYPNSNRGWGARVEPLQEQVAGRQLRQTLLLLFATVTLVLLIGCANVANLMLARGAARQREVAVRAALGAGRARLVRQFLAESTVVAALGGALGLGLAYGLTKVVAALLPPFSLPSEAVVRIDARVLLFTLVMSLAAGLLFGLAPALRASASTQIASATRAPRVSASRALVVSEVALAVVLLIGAGLLIHSFLRLEAVDPGFRGQGVLTMRLSLPPARYPEPAQVTTFYREALRRLRALPGVEDAALVSTLPLEGFGIGMTFQIEGRPPVTISERPVTHFQIVSPSYFRALRIPMERGRDLDDRDTPETTPVAVVNRTLARRYFNLQDPLGRRLVILSASGTPEAWQIVGVSGDVKISGLAGEEGPEVYVAHAQRPQHGSRLVARAGGPDPMTWASAARSAISSIDRDQPVTDLKTMNQVEAEALSQPRLRTWLLGLFAGIALLLAALGIYGVMSYSVTQRTREIGIRMALGAEPSDVRRLVVRQGMTLALAGMALGLAAALALNRVLANLLYGVTSTDPVTFLGVALLLGMVALAACYLPARRATRVNPTEALRYD